MSISPPPLYIHSLFLYFYIFLCYGCIQFRFDFLCQTSETQCARRTIWFRFFFPLDGITQIPTEIRRRGAVKWRYTLQLQHTLTLYKRVYFNVFVWNVARCNYPNWTSAMCKWKKRKQLTCAIFFLSSSSLHQPSCHSTAIDWDNSIFLSQYLITMHGSERRKENKASIHDRRA